MPQLIQNLLKTVLSTVCVSRICLEFDSKKHKSSEGKRPCRVEIVTDAQFSLAHRESKVYPSVSEFPIS